VRRFVETELRPRAREFDRLGRIDKTLYKRMGELGLLGLRYEESASDTSAERRSPFRARPLRARAAHRLPAPPRPARRSCHPTAYACR
jgi:alkylation response protein AidB-like acyl-CoA dehydrogenase